MTDTLHLHLLPDTIYSFDASFYRSHYGYSSCVVRGDR